MSHTPGPWTVGEKEWRDNGRASWLEIPVGPDGDTTAITYCIEDARLIAAAPDLLRALERLLRDYREVALGAEREGLVEAAEAAIAKACWAEGEES